MKVICTTSDKYLHLIPVFTYLFNKNWSDKQEVEIVGYSKPKCKLPKNFSFHSMGKQGTVNEWSTDLRKYFEQQPTFFLWLMEDCFIKSYKPELMPVIIPDGCGKVCLVKDIENREHTATMTNFIIAGQDTNYRLSTQPSIWNKDYLLEYLTDGLSPWEFEKQFPNRNWDVLGMKQPPVKHNEGVRKFNIYELDLNGFPQEDIDHIKTLL